MKITLVAAMCQSNRVIGASGCLPWHIPQDLARFRQLTLHHPVIMGYHTWLDIYARLGKALPKRLNIVLSRQKRRLIAGVHHAQSLEHALTIAQSAQSAQAESHQEKSHQAMIIGGAEIYHAFLPYAEQIYLTQIFGDYEGDAFFPPLAHHEWQENQAVREDGDGFAFTLWERLGTPKALFSPAPH